MKILLVASLQTTATANYLVAALRRTQHSLLVVSDVPSDAADLVSDGAPNCGAICRSKAFAPDLMLYIEGGTHRIFPVGLDTLDCPTAWYAIDTHMDYDKHVVLARSFDLTFIAQKRYMDALQRDAGVQVVWLPLAFPAEFANVAADERPLDLAFAGSVDPRTYPGRTKALEQLSALAGTVSIGPARPADMMQRYGRAKVVFNQCANADLNMRFFEAMGAGAVLLTDCAPETHACDLFSPDVHFVAYDNDVDMARKFSGLLTDASRAHNIGAAARASVLSSHTYDHRVRFIVETMSSTPRRRRGLAGDSIAAFAALNMPAEALAEVSRLFAGMGKGTRIGLVARAVYFLLKPIVAGLRLAFRLHARTRGVR